jgi:UDP-3-O-[3-hydroxymyristoyl] glucosamine N-acyltransferase
MKLGQLARQLSCVLEGDEDLEITGVAGIREAQPGELTFLANRRYYPALKETRASAIVIAREEGPVPIAALRSENPYLDFARAVGLFHEKARYAPGIHPTAVVAPSAKIGQGAHIGPYCFVDEDAEIGRKAVLHSFVTVYRGARIGDDFFAHSHVTIREGCRIGDRVILQNGAVIGGDGFAFAKQGDGRWHKILAAGSTVIEDDVEIQANSAVDRATVGETRIARGAKIDNLVQVGHGCHVGEDALLCGQVGLAGSTVIGKGCILAGQAATAGHLTLGDGAILTAQSAVSHDVPAGAVYSGSPGADNKKWLRNVAAFNRLAELQHTVRELRTEVERLRARSAGSA